MHQQPAQARAQPMGGREVRTFDPPQFLLTPIFGQDFPVHHTPDLTIWCSKFQKNHGRGSLSPLPWPIPRFFSGFALYLGSALKSQALRAPDSGFAWIASPNFWSVFASLCSRIHMPYKLRLSQYLLLLTITPEVGLWKRIASEKRIAGENRIVSRRCSTYNVGTTFPMQDLWDQTIVRACALSAPTIWLWLT